MGRDTHQPSAARATAARRTLLAAAAAILMLILPAAAQADITNGGFESGSLSGWTSSGASATVAKSGCHSGTYCAQLGKTTATSGDSSIAQSFTASSTGTVSFYYKVVCPDTVTYDWATATLKDTTAGTTVTVLPHTCSNNGSWAQATGAVTGGHAYTLTLTSHDDNYSSDPTYTLYDDVTLTAAPPPPPPSSGITNGGFESGNLSGWSPSGAASSVASTNCHGGTYCAELGAGAATNGDSSIAQSFTAPSAGNLSFYYKVVCPDTVTYDWATATLADTTAATTTTVLAKTCTNTGQWLQASAPVVSGHAYTLTLTSHDDNYSGDPTYTLYDDVAFTASAPPPPPSLGITNGGFESGSLTGWSPGGAATGVASVGCHGGQYCARVGSTSPTNGDSSLAQSFSVPSGGGTLSFYYKVICPDTVTYDWATATLTDTTAGSTVTVLPRTCTNSGAWVQATAPVTAGHAYTLTLASHDDNYAGDPTYTLYDDVSIVPPSSDPTIVAAGDIACTPSDPDFNGGAGDANGCQQMSTSNLFAGGSVLGSPVAAVLPLGDEQYENGLLSEFTGSYALSWGRSLSLSRPVAGNHEYYTSGAAGYFDYFDGAGNQAGLAGDRTQGYYSYNIGSWHVIALNSNCAVVSCAAGSAQETWLKSDLAANSGAVCTLAYWHHPLFHSGDETGGELTQQLFTDLYNAGADVVLNGHEHQYERFAPQTPAGVADSSHGIREFIVGTGGRSLEGFGTPVANSEVRDNSTYGVLRLVLHPTSYDWQFIPTAGGSFTDGGTGQCHTGQPGTSRDLPSRPAQVRRWAGPPPIDGPNATAPAKPALRHHPHRAHRAHRAHRRLRRRPASPSAAAAAPGRRPTR